MRPLYEKKNKAIQMRLKGMSYSQIKSELKVSKGSLSLWLAPYPLSTERIKELMVNSRKVENYRLTMAKKRQARLDASLEKVGKDIGNISDRELFILGFALYWAEGAKTKDATLYFANTDPFMLKVYMKWLKVVGIPKQRLKFKLHIYKDMDEKSAIDYWVKILKVKHEQFRKTYIKDSKLSDLTYKNGFGHGTCNIMFESVEMRNYVLMGIKHIISNLNCSNMRA